MPVPVSPPLATGVPVLRGVVRMRFIPGVPVVEAPGVHEYDGVLELIWPFTLDVAEVDDGEAAVPVSIEDEPE